MFTPVQQQITIVDHQRMLAVVLLSILMSGCGVRVEPQASDRIELKSQSSSQVDAYPQAEPNDQANVGELTSTGQLDFVETPVDDPSPNDPSPNDSSPNDPSPNDPSQSTEPVIHGPDELASAEAKNNSEVKPPGALEKRRKVTEAQLHKNATLLTLAMEPDIRAMELIKYLREYLTVEQKQAAVRLILQYDETFQQLKQRRAEILENARDGDNVAEQLLRVKEDIAIFSDVMRLKVEREIMTEQQRLQRAADRAQLGKTN
jgi:hypothetical protein